MNELSPDDKINLRFETVEDGLLFLFQRANKETGDTIRVRQSWSNIHSPSF
jgi:hypothetical protein